MIKNMMLDLRLLAVFHAVMAERSVTRASRRLGLSQPAISNALRRLREILDDELFQRTAHGMLPTPRALELASPVGQVLRQLEAALQPASFVAADSDRLFKIAIAPPVDQRDLSDVLPTLCPWLLIQGEDDEIVKATDVFAWAEAQKPMPQIVRMPETGHFFHRRLVDLRGAIKNGVQKNLPPLIHHLNTP